MGAPKLKLLSKNKASVAEQKATEASIQAQNEQDKKHIQVYIDQLQKKIAHDKTMQKKAAAIIESLIGPSKDRSNNR